MIYTVFDLETTGLDRTKDQIIQFAGIKINGDTDEIVDSLDLYVQPAGSYSISLGAYFKHQISPEFLSDKPYFSEVAKQIYDFMIDTEAFLTYNGNGFDIPFLKAELNKYGYDIDFTQYPCFDAFLEEKRRHGIWLENVYKKYKGKTMEEDGLVAHEAFSDVKGTYEVFKAQQGESSYGPETMYGEDGVITDNTFLEKTQPCFTLGKYRNISVEYVAKHDQRYLQWCVDKSSFTNSTKNFLSKYIQ